MRLPFATTFAAGALILTTACGGPASASSRPSPTAVPPAATTAASSQHATQQVTLDVGNSMSFTPAAFTVRAGQPVELTLRNNGQMPHDFTLTEGVAKKVTVKASGGETARVTFTIERPGAYRFVCSVGGHEKAGMVGTITAQ